MFDFYIKDDIIIRNKFVHSKFSYIENRKRNLENICAIGTCFESVGLHSLQLENIHRRNTSEYKFMGRVELSYHSKLHEL